MQLVRSISRPSLSSFKPVFNIAPGGSSASPTSPLVKFWHTEHHVMTDEGDYQQSGDFLFASRIVPIRREGNFVYARTLRRGEADTGEVVNLEQGDRLVFPAGGFEVDSRDIDEHYNPKIHGGYRPVANTVWTWYRIAPEKTGVLSFSSFPLPGARTPPMRYGYRRSRHVTKHDQMADSLSDRHTSTHSQPQKWPSSLLVDATVWWPPSYRNTARNCRCRTASQRRGKPCGRCVTRSSTSMNAPRLRSVRASCMQTH